MKTLALTAAAATILAFASAAQAAPYANCYLHIAGNPNIPCPPVHTVVVRPEHALPSCAGACGGPPA